MRSPHISRNQRDGTFIAYVPDDVMRSGYRGIGTFRDRDLAQGAIDAASGHLDRVPTAIELLVDTQLAYLAGLTDADGSVLVTHNAQSVYPVVTWPMSHRPTVERVAEWLGSKVYVHKPERIDKMPDGSMRRCKEMFQTNITGARAIALCGSMAPFMLTKQRQAELVAGWPVVRSGRVPEAVAIERAAIRAEIRRLNRRGPLDPPAETPVVVHPKGQESLL